MVRAEELMVAQQWASAVRVLQTAVAVNEGEARRRALETLAVAAAEGGRRRLTDRTLAELERAAPDRDAGAGSDPGLLLARANVALARGDYTEADAWARAVWPDADGPDPRRHDAWAVLTACYAGLGWFEEAATCLDRLDRDRLSALERRRIGRAINRWALSRTPALPIGAGAAVMFGTLAVAVVLMVPTWTRHFRLRWMRSDRPGMWFADEAERAWLASRRERYLHSVAVASALVGHLCLLLTATVV